MPHAPAMLKIICVPGRAKVHVPCPNVTAIDMMFRLFKDKKVIANITCSEENSTLKCTRPDTMAGVELYENKQRKLVDFILTDGRHGTYSCDGTVTFPPPYQKVQSPWMIHVHVEEHICKHNNNSRNCGDNPSRGVDWIWILAVVLLIIYSVTVTIIALITGVKLRETECQNDYMNTKPRPSKDRRKKKGVQNPPRHL
ncbi:uncharacterized protein si:dkey-1h24.6 isoform X2 [Toxotes jaculatrix]|uniref:uncharacterized protein si:dkey-1h24.6 isoform X2 n=1 Tax=Toxotes jaculatrix TaxID=941984 RepID=UPI001B3AA139|nr:uncharacterized protein si:dkey-1h24.6 isoform X2 [Toxotes jaculatrix]